MKHIITFLFILYALNGFGQKDSLQLGDTYLEDQIYFGVTYNQLSSQPSQVIRSGFSYGINAGYIRDISLIKSGKIALGLGIGYSFDSLKHGYKVSTVNSDVILEVDPSIQTTNAFNIHAIEFPFEFRWRTSSVNKYKFWRVYTGIKFSYNLSNSIEFTDNSLVSSFKNLERFNKLQYGLTLSAGYSTFNFNFYYGLTPIFKDAILGTKSIQTKIIKIGILFYIL